MALVEASVVPDDHAAKPAHGPGPELTVVIPTMNERDNVAPLVERLDHALAGVAWEAIFVDDDSTDGTREEIGRLSRIDGRIRCLHRIGRRGLSSACIEGIQASLAPFVAVMDADLQHDEALLPRMLDCLRQEPLDLVVGSRYVEGGGVGNWDKRRVGISGFATRLGRLVLKVEIADPMSGFFMIRRDAFDRAVRSMSAVGFKILVDLLASSSRPVRLKELPYQFRERHAGESKLDAFVAWEYLVLLADKLLGPYVPVRFVLFSMVGGIGVVAHLIVLWLSLNLAHLAFALSQGVAAGMAMIGNFTLNNFLTYSDRRLKGWNFLKGLVSFAAVCGVGYAGNVGVAKYLFDNQSSSWWLAGIAGAAIGSVWNYAVSSVVTWKRK
ncbi:dolichol monophosphate mannose synthase [Aliidongia dinghuensis]|uniref:Dolichol monophosphate mannose synthase n=1 Tax=Aliidongia dinghuensis TaxID=1867774 RepID=A0A8J2YUV9_9PROT|nr:glycosyltransferase family 2 protein [Aliidongia dinghuensis]GGF23024.1 dolichol monophosphate mannose synthase [Aliidongia dinghuensis]